VPYARPSIRRSSLGTAEEGLEAYKAIEDLFLQFIPATDLLGVPVFRYSILLVLATPYMCRVTFSNPSL